MSTQNAAREPHDLGLIEREGELSALDELIRRATDSSGRTVIIRGPPGIGKTSLLAALGVRAREAGFATLRVRAGELERDFPFGVVRQFVETALRSGTAGREELFAGDARLAEPVFAPPEDDLGRGPDAGFGTLHGLYWLTANLAERGALLLSVDDAHWADAASLRYLSYLTRRLDGLPILVAAAMRPAEPGADGDLLPRIARDPSTDVIELEPLSEDAVATLVRTEFGDGVPEEVVARCLETTGGNPFFVRELLLETERRMDGDGPTVQDIAALGPERVAEAVAARLERLGAEAPELAVAVAVLGDSATLSQAVTLAGIEAANADALVDGLVGAGILAPNGRTEFVHPIVRNAVYSRMGPAERQRWHTRAADQLTAAGQPADVVALHLLATEPTGRPEVAAALQEAGEAARARGAPDAAVRCLERALAEPPAEANRAEILLEIGRSEASLGDPRALEWLREAVELGGSSAVGLEAARALVIGLLYSGDSEELIKVCERVRAESSPGGKVHQWLTSLAPISAATRTWTGELARENCEAALAGEDVGTGLLASAAFECALTNGSADAAARLAERSIAERLFEDSGPESVEPASLSLALIMTERFETLEAFMAQGETIVRGEGDARAYSAMLALRALGRLGAGRITDAMADVELAPNLPFPAVTDLLRVAVQVQALLETDRLDEAAGLAEIVESLPVDRHLTLFQPFAGAVASLRLAQGEAGRALEVIRGIAEWEEATGMSSGMFVAWRSHAALAHAMLDEHETARGYAEEQVELARSFGAPGALGAALRVLGDVRADEHGIATLRRAVTALEGSAARLEHARAAVDLGAAIRRTGKAVDARTPLAEGLDLARRIGATTLEARAVDELVAAGARPRHPSASREKVLTPSELRVAQMAASGMSNKRIAQALYVTVKTVETHLWRAYSKLDIKSRTQLAGRLDAATG